MLDFHEECCSLIPLNASIKIKEVSVIYSGQNIIEPPIAGIQTPVDQKATNNDIECLKSQLLSLTSIVFSLDTSMDVLIINQSEVDKTAENISVDWNAVNIKEQWGGS